MPRNKKYTREQIIEAIGEKFGSIENYAKSKGTSKQNISQKAWAQSRTFMKELEQDGVITYINSSTGNNNIQAVGGSSINADKSYLDMAREMIFLLREARELLLKENRELTKRVQELEAILKGKGN
jgi:hypothetical protein